MVTLIVIKTEVVVTQYVLSGRYRLSAVAILFLVLTLTVACSRQDEPSLEAARVPDTFQFMGVGAGTVVTADVRRKLSESLGSASIDNHTPIYLDMKYKGFVKAHYPELYALDRRLNINDVVRKEYPATRLMFRHTQKAGSMFDQVELVYENQSQTPLLFKVVAKGEIRSVIEGLTAKYGSPEKINLKAGDGWSLRWGRQGDVFVVTRFEGVYQNPEYHMLIVYRNRIEAMLKRLDDAEQQRRATGKASGKEVF